MMMTSGPAIVVLLAVVTSVVDVESRPEKRNLYQMCTIMETYTGQNCRNYNGHGCFCGIGSRGNRPVDAVDACCQQHDRCYGAINFARYQFAQTVSYSYTCSGGTCRCKEPRSNQPDYDLCQCDLSLGKCLKGLSYSKKGCT